MKWRLLNARNDGKGKPSHPDNPPEYDIAGLRRKDCREVRDSAALCHRFPDCLPDRFYGGELRQESSIVVSRVARLLKPLMFIVCSSYERGGLVWKIQ